MVASPPPTHMCTMVLAIRSKHAATPPPPFCVLAQLITLRSASFMFFIVGIAMFLLPPVPGLAVYLCAGVLIPPACETEMGYIAACAYASVTAFVMKLVAQILQQKLIGECLGQLVSVRALVGVNTDLIKAIRHILEQPGLSTNRIRLNPAARHDPSSLCLRILAHCIRIVRLILRMLCTLYVLDCILFTAIAKVAILCGGPDWPTAVLCGILRLSVWQMLLGLTPIILFTIPAALAGAASLRDAVEGGLWGPIATIATMSATMQVCPRLPSM